MPSPSQRVPDLTADASWDALAAGLPTDLEASAFHYGALYRHRGGLTAERLLRLILAYACNLSLLGVVTWAAATLRLRLSDQALAMRIRHAGAWLQHLLAQVLAARLPTVTGCPFRLRLTDGTGITRPGVTRPDWLCQVTLDLQRGRLDLADVGPAADRETLARAQPQPGDLLVGDRGFGTRQNLWKAIRQGADVLVRLAWNNVPLQHLDGRPFDLFVTALRTLAPGTLGAWDVQTAPTKDQPALPGRLVVHRLPPAAAAHARQRAQRQQRRTPATPATLEAAEYGLFFTTLPAWASPALVVALYRLRWQIELAVKRYKSLLGLGRLTARHPDLCRAVLYAKLLLIVLTEDLGTAAEAFFPCGDDGGGRAASPKRLGRLSAGLGHPAGDHSRPDPVW